ncbi:endospore germination permease [Paenibacillus pini]|uniref:Spore germination protein GerXB n=1 Tax=Paenibacillus pini JCM 16418 TaxID=1236976 RepID=W7Y9N3_9BACL|nr:endospore germination permease [Paenibacillus pini]GAF07740.1 spore germination protein GerXB [Paenibacillus pini JCM 16418]
MSTSKITFVQVCLILMLTNGLTSHVILNPMILDASGRDAWLSVLFATVLFVPWVLILVWFMRKSGQSKLQPWLAARSNPIISWIAVAPVILQLYLIGGLTVMHTATWTITNYLPATPKLVLIASIAFACYYAAKLGINSIAISSGILLPIVVLLGIFVSVANTPVKDFSLLRPILEHGMQPPLTGMIYAGGGFIELLIIITMQHRIKTQVKSWHLLIFALIICLMTIGPIIGGITEFGPLEAAKQTESPYEQWRLVKIGDYIEHVDFLSVYQWLSGATVRISIALFLLADLMPFKTREMGRRFILAITFSYILLSMLPISQERFYQWVYHFYFPFSLISGIVSTMIWVGISFSTKKKPKEEKTT